MQRIEVPGVGIVEFPDNMTDEQIAGAIQANYGQQQPQEGGIADTLAFLPAGANKGAANLLGLPVDLLSKVTNPALEAMGVAPAEKPFMGSDWLKERLRRAGMIGDPTTRTERVLDRVGQEMGAAALPVGGALTAARMGVTSSAPILQQMLQAASQSPLAFAATEAGLAATSGLGAAAGQEIAPDQPLSEMVGQLVGGLAPYGAVGATRRLFRGGETGRRALQENIETFGRAGVSPSVGQGTQSPARQAVETVLGNTPGGGTVIQRAATQTAEKLQKQVDNLANRYSTRSGVEIAGRTIERGIKEGFAGRFGAQTDKLFSRLDKYIPGSNRVTVDNTRRTLEQLTNPIEGAEATSRLLTNPKAAQIASAFMEDASSGVMPYTALKQLRSKVGRMLGSPDIISDIPKAELKQLYGALSRDMESAARDAGPEALAAFNRANRYYKSGIARIDDVLERIANRANPEEVFRAATRGKDGASTIRAVRKSLDPEEWDVVASTVLRRLGRARPSAQNEVGDVFSVESFLTGWNQLSKEARSSLFSGTRYAGVSDDLDKLAATAARIRDASRVLANPSGTAGQGANITAGLLAGGTALTGDIVTPATIGALAGLSAGGAELMTNPKFVRWLAKSTEIPAQRLPGYIARLSVAMREEDPETLEAVNEYLSILGGKEQ